MISEGFKEIDLAAVGTATASCRMSNDGHEAAVYDCNEDDVEGKGCHSTDMVSKLNQEGKIEGFNMEAKVHN